MTRVYMDFCRMEGEAIFLVLLPEKERQKLTNYWYRDASDSVKKHLYQAEHASLSEPDITYQTSAPQAELYSLLNQHLSKAMNKKHLFYDKNHAAFKKINAVKGKAANLMPEVSLLFDEHNNQVYTLIRNSGHSNLTGLLYEEENRLPEEDYMTIVPGIIGAYPSAYYQVRFNQSSEGFTNSIYNLKTEQDYKRLLDEYGVRRTHPDFWAFSDKVHTWFKQDDPLNAGLLDYNRLENR